MYIISTLKEFNAYCCKDFEYYDIHSGQNKFIRKGESVTMLHTKYFSDDIDKVVCFDYIIKEDKTHISMGNFLDYFMTLYNKRKKIAKNIIFN